MTEHLADGDEIDGSTFAKYCEKTLGMPHDNLLSKFAYIEVPEEDAKRVMKALNGTEYKGRTVR